MGASTIPTTVTIVGAGTSGIAVAAYLQHYSIPYALLEREDCIASLWRKYAYDRVHLHLSKHLCKLPLLNMPESYPTYPSRTEFLDYLDKYVKHFSIRPKFHRQVIAAEFDDRTKNWKVRAEAPAENGEVVVEEYVSKFLVIATGESCDPRLPEIDGLDKFQGELLHSTRYKNGKPFAGKNVLVVGCGNSGMEIALDLTESGAKTSIVVRSPMHVTSRPIMRATMFGITRIGTQWWLDKLMVLANWMWYGDLSKYGIQTPDLGPFYIKDNFGKYPIVDIGTIAKIKSREIQVLPAIKSIKSNGAVFENGKEYPFDTIIFCTGFKRTVTKWLQVDESTLDEYGLRSHAVPQQWKAENGLYFVGLARYGFPGAACDAMDIANDIKAQL